MKRRHKKETAGVIMRPSLPAAVSQVACSLASIVGKSTFVTKAQAGPLFLFEALIMKISWKRETAQSTLTTPSVDVHSHLVKTKFPGSAQHIASPLTVFLQMTTERHVALMNPSDCNLKSADSLQWSVTPPRWESTPRNQKPWHSADKLIHSARSIGRMVQCQHDCRWCSGLWEAPDLTVNLHSSPCLGSQPVGNGQKKKVAGRNEDITKWLDAGWTKSPTWAGNTSRKEHKDVTWGPGFLRS